MRIGLNQSLSADTRFHADTSLENKIPNLQQFFPNLRRKNLGKKRKKHYCGFPRSHIHSYNSYSKKREHQILLSPLVRTHLVGSVWVTRIIWLMIINTS